MAARDEGWYFEEFQAGGSGTSWVQVRVGWGRPRFAANRIQSREGTKT